MRTRIVPGNRSIVAVGVVAGPPPSGRKMICTGMGVLCAAGSEPRRRSLEKTAPFLPGEAATAGTVHSVEAMEAGRGGLRYGSFVAAFETTVA